MKIPSSLKWKSQGSLGSGGQATVHKVIDETGVIAGQYALKCLAKGKPPKAYVRFAREIEAIKRVSHSAIVRIVDHSGPDDDFQYYVMEYNEGARPLKKLIGTSDNPFVKNAILSLEFFVQLVGAIAAWSKSGISHRDLSLGNVLLLPDNSPKVIDFGICQIDDVDTVTLDDEGVGTPNYMAPECESGAAGVVLGKSDIYSAGKILWALIANQNAFSREEVVFNAKAMTTVFPNAPETWHLHHVFQKTIRHQHSDRGSSEEVLAVAQRTRYLISSCFPPLEKIQEFCPICGVGTLGPGEGLHSVFGNPNPPGIYSYQCNYCGMCLAINQKVSRDVLKKRSELR